MNSPKQYSWSEEHLKESDVDVELMQEWDEIEDALQATESHRYECPNCAETRDTAAHRNGIQYDGDTSLRSKTYPIKLDEDEDVSEVFDRSDEEYVNFDAADFTRLQQTGKHEGYFQRTIYCEDHDTVSITYVGAGEATVKEGSLKPNLEVKPSSY